MTTNCSTTNVNYSFKVNDDEAKDPISVPVFFEGIKFRKSEF